MTTIAYRDGVLAGDTLRTSNGMRDGYSTKVHRVGRVLVAAAGSGALCSAFLQWVAGGLNGPSPFEGKQQGNGIVVAPNGHAVIWGEHGPWDYSGMPFFALGSGEQVAMGAMAQGATAVEAVRHAIGFDTISGGDVQSVSLQ